MFILQAELVIYFNFQFRKNNENILNNYFDLGKLFISPIIWKFMTIFYMEFDYV